MGHLALDERTGAGRAGNAGDTWYEHAGVRGRPHPVLDGEAGGTEDGGTLWFSPHLVPALDHPAVAGRPEVHDGLLAHTLLAYLEFTRRLEHRIVNRAALVLADGPPLPGTGDDTRFEAQKIYCDEAYHAVLCADLARQVAASTGVIAHTQPALPIERELAETLASVPAAHHDLALVLFAAVCETLVTATLREVPADTRVTPAVRLLVSEHARDEARHHAFFASLLAAVWPRLDAVPRRTVGPLLPRFVLAYLAPDTDATAAHLTASGLTPRVAVDVAHDVARAFDLAAQARDVARPTVRVLRRAGALDTPVVSDAFAAAGLI